MYKLKLKGEVRLRKIIGPIEIAHNNVKNYQISNFWMNVVVPNRDYFNGICFKNLNKDILLIKDGINIRCILKNLLNSHHKTIVILNCKKVKKNDEQILRELFDGSTIYNKGKVLMKWKGKVNIIFFSLKPLNMLKGRIYQDIIKII